MLHRVDKSVNVEEDNLFVDLIGVFGSSLMFLSIDTHDRRLNRRLASPGLEFLNALRRQRFSSRDHKLVKKASSLFI